MSTRKIKELIAEYTYEELGFPVVLKDIVIVEDRDYEYPLINHSAVVLQAAFSLVMENQNLDGARIRFIRRFIGLSLDQLAEVIGDISKSTLHKWESDKNKTCELSSEQLRSIYLALRNEIIKQIGSRMDQVLIKEFSRSTKIAPLNFEKNNLIAV